jgi:hypothetical protein
VRHNIAANELSWREVRRVLHEELNSLTARYRVPLLLCYLEGKTQKQAAVELGLAKSTLRERIERGRSLLRARLVRRGLGPTGLLGVAVCPTANASAAVPLSLMISTIKAASWLAPSPTVESGAISANAASLTKGVLNSMLLSKIKTTAALALLLLACAGGMLALLSRLAAQDEATNKTKAKEGRIEPNQTAIRPKSIFQDLTKIDRTIAKEPKYTNQPYYALLAIGQEAKKHVWLVVDGETLYVDRNGNGDLTETNERIPRTKKYENIGTGQGWKGMDIFDIGEVEGLRLRLEFWVPDKSFIPVTDFDKELQKDLKENGWEFSTLWRVDANCKSISGQIPVTFCRRPQDAQICHLAGPLKSFLTGEDRQLLVRTAVDNFLNVEIGTPGLPPRKWTKPKFAPVGTNEVPADLHPVAHFEFPHKDANQPTIKLEVVLNQRGCDQFGGRVRVPANAGTGKAKVSVSFSAWPEGKVAPTTFEVPIVEKGTALTARTA